MNQSQAPAQAVPSSLGLDLPPSPASLQDPCPEVPVALEARDLRPGWEAALSTLGACLREQMRAVELADGALAYLKAFKRSVTERRLSQMGDEELASFLKAQFVSPAELVGFTAEERPLRAKVRDSFAERDLTELRNLALRRQRALEGLEARSLAALSKRRALIERAASQSDRWKLALALLDTAQDGLGAETAQKVAQVLRESGMEVPEGLAAFPVRFLHPVAMRAVVPDPGQELAPLHRAHENPFTLVRRHVAEFGGTLEMLSEQRKLYLELAQADNPAPKPHAPAAKDAVRVAVLDSGVDFVRYPELGLFLGDGQDGAIASRDYADQDINPYLPALGEAAHGTGTTATLLTTVARFAPEVLESRKLELAVWKVSSVRGFLAFPWFDGALYESRLGTQEALISQALSGGEGAVLPSIVSISAAFPLQPFLVNSRHEDALLRAPWLWVMAAGNDGVDVAEAPMPSCLGDVPADKRVDARILCVGALKRGIVEDRVAGYSNFGARVDLYAYESYIDLCPNGTSCATPAVSGAAAALASRHPELSPERIKELLLAASEERELEVDGRAGRGPASSSLSVASAAVSRRRVRVFDPATMMARLFRLAELRADGTPDPGR